MLLAMLRCVLSLLPQPAILSDAPAGAAIAAVPPCLPASHFNDPESFLLAVMNDPSAATLERIRAAEALLPYVGKTSSK